MVSELQCLKYYSGVAARLRPSIIRELLKAIAKPGVISFAGGLPAAEVFPIEQIKVCCNAVLEADPCAMQYGPTEGYLPLKEQLIEWLAKKGIKATPDMMLFTTGAQQAVTLLATILLDQQDLVLVEQPTYPGSISAIDLQSPHFRVLPSLPDGSLDMELIERQMLYAGCKPRLVYLVPTFANPSGRTISQPDRELFLTLAHRHHFPIIEDDPYSDLRYEGEAVLPMKALEHGESVIYLGSFSKILAPGMRLGFVVGAPELIQKLVILKQAVDMETSGFIQRIASEFMRRQYLEPHLVKVRETYGTRMRAMIQALTREMPQGTTWTHVEGGMFIWVTLPPVVDTEKLLPKALELDVAYIPGKPFCLGGGGSNAMRLNFTNASPALIDEGIRRIGLLFKEVLAR